MEKRRRQGPILLLVPAAAGGTSGSGRGIVALPHPPRSSLPLL